ncbi:UGSC family (seleno)protein [Actinophytocola sp.]|uniref:UGSC family (seleno)protein n=1 Tax=Actinophytocola sp. TaxID=1872138 RepID=UPI003D6BDF76
MVSIEVLDPTVPPRSALAITPAPRLAKLNGRSLGFVNNNKPNVPVLFDELSSQLGEQYEMTEALRVRKPQAPVRISADDLRHFEQKCDAVILAVADCGSCTSWLVRDMLALEEVGIPTVLIASQVFVNLATAEALANGLPSISMIEVPHPFDVPEASDVVDLARKIIPEVANLLLASSPS